MIVKAIRQAAIDLWDELLLLAVFNLIWSIGSLPGLILIRAGLTGNLLLFLAGLICLLPWPLVTFGLFFVVWHIGEGRVVKFSDFFRQAWQNKRPAYQWGGTNLFLGLVLWFNLHFYADIRNMWAVAAQLFIIALGTLWAILQLVALPMYPRLQQPSLKLALQNSLVVIGRYPLVVLVLVAFVVVLGLIALIIPISLLLVSMAIIAVLANRLVAGAVAQELKRTES